MSYTPYHTVWSNSTVTFDDGIAPKVMKIVHFWKKYMKSDCLAFLEKPFPKIFYQILILFSQNRLYGKLCLKKSFFSDFSIKLNPVAIFLHYTMIYISIFHIWDPSDIKSEKLIEDSINLKNIFFEKLTKWFVLQSMTFGSLHI